ncbi:MAG: hypothetical protein HY360_11590 [Verrucomicrobia bacterium]|nr:hypothetical protein [Verrucomicrobiota bacterium]
MTTIFTTPAKLVPVHNGAHNIVFLDGHVQRMTRAEFVR